MKENFNLLCKIVSRISIRSWEEWVEGFSNLLNKILYDLKPGLGFIQFESVKLLLFLS